MPIDEPNKNNSVKKIKAKKNHANNSVSNKVKVSKNGNKSVQKNKKTTGEKTAKQSTFFRRFGALLIIFFIFSILYFSWLYAVPFILNTKVNEEQVNNFINPKFNVTLNFADSNVYTTPALGMGIRFKDFKILYPNAKVSTGEGVFLKAKSANMEIAYVPFLMKTIKFNQFILRGVSVNTFQNENGQYAYQEHLKSYFNPEMKKYVLEVPAIKLQSYSFDNYNQQTDTFKKDSGASLLIRPAVSKSVLAKSQRANTITLK